MNRVALRAGAMRSLLLASGPTLWVVPGEDEPVFSPGDRVRILVGPFEDFAGVVREVNSELGKLTVTLEVLRREQVLNLDFSQAARLDRSVE